MTNRFKRGDKVTEINGLHTKGIVQDRYDTGLVNVRWFSDTGYILGDTCQGDDTLELIKETNHE